MNMRWGLGPVFVYESLMNARRWQVYAGRSLFVLVLLIGMGVVWVNKANLAMTPFGTAPTIKMMAAVGLGFFYALTGLQLALILLAAPAATAGSICLDRARGTLLHMMVTDLSDVEIVLGKLAARLAPVLGLVACGLPVTALAALLGGIDFGALFGAFAVSIALVVLGCSLAMAVSVRAKRPHEVLMAVYLIEGVWLLALPIWWMLVRGAKIASPPDWFRKANPFELVFSPYSRPGFVAAADYAAFVAVTLAISAALVGFTILTMRRAVIAEAGRGERASGRGRIDWGKVFPSLPGPTLDGSPVLWREWHRNRPSRMARRIWMLLMIVTWGLAAWGTALLINEGDRLRPSPLALGFLLQEVFGLLLLSVMAPTAMGEERVRGSLDVLLSTPIPTRSVVAAKWWGAYRTVLVLAILPFYTALFLGSTAPAEPAPIVVPPGITNYTPPPTVPLTLGDRAASVAVCTLDFLASGAAMVSLGILLATWVRRPGRAVAMSLIAFILAGIGWIFVVEASTQLVMNHLTDKRWMRSSLLSLSPIAGPMNGIETLLNVYEQRTSIWIAFGVVVLIKATIALGLFWLTVATFDRCLGRVRVRGRPMKRPATAAMLVSSPT